MIVLLAGGTGFIGTALVRRLVGRGHRLRIITRRPADRPAVEHVAYVGWDDASLQEALEGCGGVVNLAGASIAGGRWTASRKTVLRASRLDSTRRLVDAMAARRTRPSVLVNASAVGFYGARGDDTLTEDAGPGTGFLAELCQAWEGEARRAEGLGVRVVRLRIGLVLAVDGGVLQRMVPPFRWGVGGPLGSGRQWMSWIHREDVVGLMEWALSRREVSGVLNATAPEPATMRTFCATLGRVLRRPSWAPVPAAVLRLLLGELSELLLTGQRVLPAVAQAQGYTFRHAELDGALRACLE